jgi:glutaconate CoA-transferase subunit A
MRPGLGSSLVLDARAASSRGAAERNTVLEELDAAVGRIGDGDVVGVGGAITASHPMALVRALARHRPRNLTVVSPAAGLDVEILIAAGCVAKVVSCYVGLEAIAGVAPLFRAAVESGRVEIVDVDEAHCVIGLRAAAQRLPFLPWRGGVGTSYPLLNEQLKEFVDPVAGEPLLAVPAIKLDFALLHADGADCFGNAQSHGTGNMDEAMGAAASTVLLQVDRLLDNDAVRRNPERTRYWRDTHVVLTPFGTHPYSSEAVECDGDHIRAFAAAARGSESELAAYMQLYVYEPRDHVDYLERVGMRQLTRLML